LDLNKSGIISLDPHTTQTAVQVLDKKGLATYRTTNPRIIKWSQLDTTMAF